MGSRGAANAPFAALEAAGFQGGRHAPWSMGMQGESEYLALARWGSGESGSLPGRNPSAMSLVRVSGHEGPDWRRNGQTLLWCARLDAAAAPAAGGIQQGEARPLWQDGSGRSTEHILRYAALPPCGVCVYYTSGARRLSKNRAAAPYGLIDENAADAFPASPSSVTPAFPACHPDRNQATLE